MVTSGINVDQDAFFLGLLRTARMAALADAEAFHQIVHAIELVGQIRLGKVGDLGKYKDDISKIASRSCLAKEIPSAFPAYHASFSCLYDELRIARNDAVHQGAHARLLTSHAVETTLILEDALMAEAEDALMAEARLVSQFMVRNVTEAKPWHPVSYVRQQMLKYAFSHLPIYFQGKWWIISDYAIAKILRNGGNSNDRKGKMAATVESVFNALGPKEASIIEPKTEVTSILSTLDNFPLLIVENGR